MTRKPFRNGDVLLRPVAEVRGVEQKEEQVVLAYGEATGHSHRISQGAAALFRFDDRVYLRVASERAALTHEEHHRIDLPAGNFEVLIQRDYVPGGWTRVVD